MKRMTTRGMTLTADEYKTVLDYLSKQLSEGRWRPERRQGALPSRDSKGAVTSGNKLSTGAIRCNEILTRGLRW